MVTLKKKTGLISLSGTLVPAKTLNSLVSKIPVVGNILVGDKVGEGVFGESCVAMDWQFLP